MLARNLTAFGDREFMQVRDLMDTYVNRKETMFFEKAMFLEYNQESGLVYLEDIHGKKAVYNYKRNCLEDWIECPECHLTGFYRDFYVKAGQFKCCSQYFKGLHNEEDKE